MKAGVYVSIGPDVEYDEDIKTVVRSLKDYGPQALHQILVETDGPVHHRGEEANPTWIPRIIVATAEPTWYLCN